jgi:hypothetical protein
MHQRYVVSASVLLLTLACGGTVSAEADTKPADLIVGKWLSDFGTVKGKVHTRQFVEFRKDGTFTSTEVTLAKGEKFDPKKVRGKPDTGKYSLVTDSEIELSGQGEEREVKVRFKAAVTKETLVLTPDEAQIKKGAQRMPFKRVKEGLNSGATAGGPYELARG